MHPSNTGMARRRNTSRTPQSCRRVELPNEVLVICLTRKRFGARVVCITTRLQNYKLPQRICSSTRVNTPSEDLLKSTPIVGHALLPLVPLLLSGQAQIYTGVARRYTRRMPNAGLSSI